MKAFDKSELLKCETWLDADGFFKELFTEALERYVSTVVKAKDYISLTMRDDFLLERAKEELECRKLRSSLQTDC